ncbi:MAG: helix-turn-helix transcriptional regulator [Candidatus Tectomicrobia bacterium]|nr:helix-turn-helix transcriptional regulator [Candidatus Tectomicrobia bacterium]
MSGQDAFERVLASLQGAALDDEFWPATSRLINEACATRANSLIVGEGAGNDVKVHFAHFYQGGERRQDLEREYFETYYPSDERIPRLRQLPDSRLTLVKDLYEGKELKSSFAFNEWVRRRGNQNSLNVRMDGPEGTRIVWSLAGRVGSGTWDSAIIDTIQSLLPHVRQLVRVRQALDGANALGASVIKLLDHTGVGAILLDRRGRVVERNDQAGALLQFGRDLSDKDGFLCAWLPADNARLQGMLARALPSFGGDGQTAGGSMTVRRSPGIPKLVLHIHPLHEQGLQFGSVSVVVLVVDPTSRPRLNAGLVAEALNLSVAESQVAVMLAEGKTVRDIAVATGRQASTVKVLVRRAYRKLGISRQVDLARLVLSLRH